MSSYALPSIEWDNPNVLSQILENIKHPLTKIIETSSKRNNSNSVTTLQNEVIFSSSKQIQDVIEHILAELKTKSVSLTYKQNPEIFQIYQTNDFVKQMCTNTISPSRITKPDQLWLLNLEKEIYDSISKKDINIYDLSYKMAVSERQLYRKITELTHLTPNKYIRVLRLHKAKQIIEEYLQHSVSQIAYAVGYNDVHYFTKLFYEQYKITPKDLILSLK